MSISQNEYDALMYLLQTQRVDWDHETIQRLSQSKGFGRNGFVEELNTKKIVYARRLKLRTKATKHNMYIAEGSLMAIGFDRATKMPITLTVVSDEDAPNVILQEHEIRGHIGINALFNMLSKIYVGIKKQRVISTLRACKHCLLEKAVNVKVVHNIPIKVYEPLQRLGIDYTLYQPPYPHKKVNIMTCIDYFSRFGWGFIMESDTAKHTAATLRSLFLRLGRIPRELQCDNGAQFTSDIVRSLMELMGVDMKFALPYTPTTGGRFERYHPNLKHKINSAFRQNADLTVEEALDSALFMYNTAAHSSLSYKGKLLTPLQVWHPGTVDWSRLPKPNPQLDTSRVAKVITPPPCFDEGIWNNVVNLVHETGLSATEAVMRAETRIMFPGQKQRETVSVGDKGILPLRKHEHKKGRVRNLPVKVSEVTKTGQLRLQLLDRNFTEVDKDIANPVSARSFKKVPTSPASSVTANEQYPTDMSNIRLEQQLTGKLHFCTRTHLSTLQLVDSQSDVPHFISTWCKQFLKQSAEMKEACVLSLLASLAESVKTNGKINFSGLPQNILSIITHCQPIPQGDLAIKQIFQVMFIHLPSNARKLLSEVKKANESDSESFYTCRSDTDSVDSTSTIGYGFETPNTDYQENTLFDDVSQSENNSSHRNVLPGPSKPRSLEPQEWQKQPSAVRRQKLSEKRCAEFLFSGAVTVSRCACKARINKCGGLKCTCAKNLKACTIRCCCKGNCVNIKSVKSSYVKNNRGDEQNIGVSSVEGSHQFGLAQVGFNCYVGSILTCIRVLPWWHSITEFYGHLHLVKIILELMNSNHRYLSSMNVDNYQSDRHFIEVKSYLASLFSLLDWDKNTPGTGLPNDAVEFYEFLIQKLLASLEQIEFGERLQMEREICLLGISGAEPVLRVESEFFLFGLQSIPGDYARQPQYLTIHLNRQESEQVPICLKFPADRLRTTTDNESDKEYNLRGVVCFDAAANHYTSYVFENGHWYKYDGSSRCNKPLTQIRSIWDASAYCLFYIKCDKVSIADHDYFIGSRSMVDSEQEVILMDGLTVGHCEEVEEQVEEVSKGIDVTVSQIADPLADTLPITEPFETSVQDTSGVSDELPSLFESENKPEHTLNKKTEPIAHKNNGSETKKKRAAVVKQMSGVHKQSKNKTTIKLIKTGKFVEHKEDSEDDFEPLEKHFKRTFNKKTSDFSAWLEPKQQNEELEQREIEQISYGERELFREIRRSVLSRSQDTQRVTWGDIIGQEEAKLAINRSLVWPHQNPHIFEGIKPYKGILLYGPPGTGKTLLAKAVANEIKSTFLFVSSKNVLSKYIGDSCKNVGFVFTLAKNRAPSIIFIDEIDSICSSRESDRQSNHDTRVVDELLQEIDGFEELENVILIGATNLPWNLDAGITRRLGKKIYMPLPTIEDMGRLIRHLCVDEINFDVSDVIHMLEGYSSSDISNICSEAKLLAAQEAIENNLSQRPKLEERHMVQAISKMPRSVPKELIRKYEKWNAPTH